MSTKSYAMATRDRLVEAGNFADADTDVDDVVQIIEDDEREINRLKAENAKMKEERDELFRENVRLRSMANGTQDDAAFGRLLTFADWWDANYPFSPDEGKLLRKSWAKIVQLQAVNDKMREALTRIAGGKDARWNYEEVAWHMAQFAAEALAAEGGAK